MGGTPHALLIPFPAQGHINPMMQLAWKLVSDGFLITFLNTDYNHQRIDRANSNNNKSVYQKCDMIRMISIPDGLPPQDKRNDTIKLLQSLENSMWPCAINRLIEDINEEEEEQEVTCMIVDVWICFWLQKVANLHHISLAAFYTSPASNFAIRYFSPTLVSNGILSSDGIPKENTTVQFIPSMPPIYSGDLPWLSGGEYMFRLGIRMAQEIRQIKWILFNSLYELEAPVVDDLARQVGAYPIGPLIPSEFLDGERSGITKAMIPSFWAEEVDCLDWLDKQSVQSVVYVSFGSLSVWSERQVEELALGLEATQKPFLWVVRPDLMDGDKAVMPPGFLERVRDRGCIISWAPQLWVLSHPSVACFVTHCGWNSVQESITMGVPMLCCPYFSDQFVNRTYIVDVWKVGLSLNANGDGIIDKAEFSNSVERLLVGDESMQIRKEVSKLKGIARDAVKAGGSSFNNYNLFVKSMKISVIY